MFRNREDAGKQLGKTLLQKKFLNPIVLALPRGGVPVADEVSKILDTSLDVVIARKIGAPHHLEYGIGAMSEDEMPLFNQEALSYFDSERSEVQSVVDDEKKELKRRVSRYRHNKPLPTLTGKSVIVVDDGLATGVTVAAVGKYLKKFKPHKVILAVPVCPKDLNPLVKEYFDEVICLHRPENLRAVGLWYDSFNQVEDDEVIKTLQKYQE